MVLTTLNVWNSSAIGQGKAEIFSQKSVLFIVISFRGEFQHGEHPWNWEEKKEVTKGKKGKESGQSGGQSSPEGKLLQDIIKYG